MKQINLFGAEFEPKQEGKYTSKIESPIYEPKNRKPYLGELCNKEKTNRILREIEASGLCEDEKQFLRYAAQRHLVFH